MQSSQSARIAVIHVIATAIVMIGFVSTPGLAAEPPSPDGALGTRGVAFGGPPPSGSASASVLSAQPIAFIENRGQWEGERRFIANRGGMAATLEPDAVVLHLLRDGQLTVVRLAFAGASPTAAIVGQGQSPGVYNFLIGNDPARWRTGVPAYSEVLYRGIWEGVDVRIHEVEGRLKYDVVVAPGASLDRIAIRGEGFTGLAIEPDGSLAMQLPGGDVIRQPQPVTWQESGGGARHVVPCRYRLVDATHYSFDVPERDPHLPLVIDPGLEWSTYLGGVGEDWAWSVALGNTGEVVVAGETTAADFPTTPGVYGPTFSGDIDGFISCLDPDEIGNSQLVWSTFLGGAFDERILALGLVGDDPNSVIICGGTRSADFPTTPGAYDPTFNASMDAFVARLGGAGTTLDYSTFLGAEAFDLVEALRVDESGVVTVGGLTYSTSFPTTPGAYDTGYNGSGDAFVTRLDASGSSLVYSTFLGGTAAEGFYRPSTYDIRFLDLVVTSNAETIVGGRTLSSDFPTTPGAYDTTYNGPSDVFVTRLNAGGSELVWSTFLGGTGEEGAVGVTLRPSGDVAFSVYTWSTDMPTTPGAFDTTMSGAGTNDGYLGILDGGSGSHLLYGTYIGGPGFEAALAIDSDPVLDDLILVGLCQDGFPITEGAYSPIFNGGLIDGWVARLSPGGNGLNDLIYSSYLGGAGEERAHSVALDESEGGGLLARALVAGPTMSSDFPTTPGAYQPDLVDADSFVCRIGPLWPVDPTTAVPGAQVNGSPAAVWLGNVHPNPAPGIVAYRIELPEAVRVGLHVYDLQGRLVAKLIDRRIGPGSHDFSWAPAANVSPGTYVLRLDSDGRQEAQKIVLIP